MKKLLIAMLCLLAVTALRAAKAESCVLDRAGKCLPMTGLNSTQRASSIRSVYPDVIVYGNRAYLVRDGNLNVFRVLENRFLSNTPGESSQVTSYNKLYLVADRLVFHATGIDGEQSIYVTSALSAKSGDQFLAVTSVSKADSDLSKFKIYKNYFYFSDGTNLMVLDVYTNQVTKLNDGNGILDLYGTKLLAFGPQNACWVNMAVNPTVCQNIYNGLDLSYYPYGRGTVRWVGDGYKSGAGGPVSMLDLLTMKFGPKITIDNRVKAVAAGWTKENILGFWNESVLTAEATLSSADTGAITSFKSLNVISGRTGKLASALSGVKLPDIHFIQYDQSYTGSTPVLFGGNGDVYIYNPSLNTAKKVGSLSVAINASAKANFSLTDSKIQISSVNYGVNVDVNNQCFMINTMTSSMGKVVCPK